MKTATLTSALMIVTLTTVSAARADHRISRRLDDLTFKALADARAIRWEIVEHFDASRDYAELSEDAINLVRGMRDVEDAIFVGRGYRSVLRELNEVHELLHHLDEHVAASDYARVERGRYEFSRGGYVFHAGTRHGGYLHVRELMGLIERMDDSLGAIYDELGPVVPGTRRPYGIRRELEHEEHEVVPGPMVLPPPPTVPLGPSLPPSSTRTRGPRIDVPVGGLVFRFDVD